MDSSEETDEDTKRWVKIAAEHELNFVVKTREASMEQAASMAKWLLASLLAINGAGALATINALEKLAAPELPAALFVIGMLLTLLSATVIQRQNYAALPGINKMIGYWLSVIDDGEEFEPFQKQVQGEITAAMGWKWLGPSLGWVSAIFFVLGTAALGYGLGR